MKKSISITLSMLLAWGGVSAQKIDFEEYDLPNGLHVILHQDNSTPITAVSVLYHVGSKNEDPVRTGFAHFFEHLMFEGSDNIGRGDYMKLVQGSGGELNANTSFDRTYYYELLPSNQLELGLWMEAERMLHLKVDKEGVETQRKVVKEERSQRLDNRPYGSILEQVFKHGFKVHPYNWVPIGSAQYIDQATLDEFMDFYKTFYVPNNATLCIAGDINVGQTKEWITKYFGDIAKGTKEIPRPKVVEPPLGGEVKDVVYDNIQLPAVVHGYRSPAQGTPDFYAVSMLNTLLTGGGSARLTKELVDKQQKSVGVFSFPLSSEDPGLSLIIAIAGGGVKVEDLDASIDAELEKIRSNGLTDKEFEKLRNQVESEFVSQSASIASRCENLANYHVYYGDANLINTEIERYMKVSKEDIQRVAKEYFHKDNRVNLYYLPKK
ncbi:MAG: M16 family metallopeptidase [Bacteroidia bacterium]